MKKLYTVIAATLFIAIPSISIGQNDTESFSQTSSSKYLNRAAQVRAEVWNWCIPAFNNYIVPEKYSDESAVILARHRQIDIMATKGSVWTNPTGKIFYTDIDRKLIKINDQVALDTFSEYSFKEETRWGIIGNSSIAMTIIGARIIKPDGTISEVDVSESSVSITEGRKDKEAYKKLAIPELQENDILDIFICEIREMHALINFPVQFVPFFSADTPAMNYSFQLTVGKNMTIEHRSINGAPQLTMETDFDKNIILRAACDKVMRINDLKNLRWLSVFRDLPVIRIATLQNASKMIAKPQSARPIGVHKNVSFDRIIEDAKYNLAAQNPNLSFMNDIKKKVKDIVASYKSVNPELEKKELADLIYSALNFKWDVNSDGAFMLILDQLLKENGVESKIGYTTNRYHARKEEVLCADDLLLMVAANNGTQLFFSPYRYMIPGEIPPGVQGESATIFTTPEVLDNSKIDVGTQKMITIPESAPEYNVNRTRINAAIISGNDGKLTIKRNSIWTGGLKDDIQPWLLLYENWDTTMRQYLHIDNSFIDELNEKPGTRKLADQFERNLEKDRKEYKETIKQEIIAYHNTEPDEVKDYLFTSFGVTSAQPNLEYDVTYVMDNFIRTAGEHLILDAGKLIGIQWDPTDNERARNVDAYIPTARIFENEILIGVPNGYIAGDVEHFNVNYSNNYLSFEATAVIEGNTIIIKAKKVYHKAYIPFEDWGKLIDIIDKTNSFYSSSIIFQKK